MRLRNEPEDSPPIVFWWSSVYVNFVEALFCWRPSLNATCRCCVSQAKNALHSCPILLVTLKLSVQEFLPLIWLRGGNEPYKAQQIMPLLTAPKVASPSNLHMQCFCHSIAQELRHVFPHYSRLLLQQQVLLTQTGHVKGKFCLLDGDHHRCV